MPVRPREDSDLEQCVRLLRDVHRLDGYPTYWPGDPEEWLSPTRMLGAWVADDQGRVVGHVALAAVHAGPAATVWSDAAGVLPGRLAATSRLFVVHDGRRAGVGGALFDTACAEAVRLGLCPVLDVVETNRDAIRLYERRGFSRVQSEPWADAREEPLTIHYYVSARRHADRAP
jgi:GNAT superfamily N-acetyltransferase